MTTKELINWLEQFPGNYIVEQHVKLSKVVGLVVYDPQRLRSSGDTIKIP